MKRFFGTILIFAVLMVSMPTASAVGTSASSAILMEASSGRVLYEQNIHESRLIASITKLMTALVALESGHDLQDMVNIDPAWAGVEGSSIYLQPGEQVTLETLLYGMLLRSGNDAALAVAGVCGGSVEEFVARMNEKAVQLGMENSHFANPNGLNAEGHYSSAYDMALLARACLENEELAKILSTKSITLGTRTFTNHNKLLWRYEGCIGLKTGFTEKAGRTLVSAAQRDGMTLICVTLNDPNDWADHAALFDYGFEHYQTQTLMSSGEVVCQIPVTGSLVPFCPVVAGESAWVCLAPETRVREEIRLDFTALQAPVSAGARVGEVIYDTGDGEPIVVPLLSGKSVRRDLAERQNFFGQLKQRLYELSSG